MDRAGLNSLVADVARAWIGTPYRNQASIKGQGADCLGVVRGVWREVYQEEPEKPPKYSNGWFTRKEEDVLLPKIQEHFEEAPREPVTAGTLVLFRMHPKMAIKHCGIITDARRDLMVHALSGKKVQEITMNDRYWSKCVGTFQFPLKG